MIPLKSLLFLIPPGRAEKPLSLVDLTLSGAQYSGPVAFIFFPARSVPPILLTSFFQSLSSGIRQPGGQRFPELTAYQLYKAPYVFLKDPGASLYHEYAPVE